MLEILLAMSIFALVSVGTLITFRTASRTYSSSQELMNELQGLRATRNALSRDLRAVYLTTETSYGARLRTEERDDSRSNGYNVINQARQRAEDRLAGDDTVDYALEYLLDQMEEGDFADSYFIPNMDFNVTDGGEVDTVSFVRRQQNMSSRRAQPWGLVRMTYSIGSVEIDGENVPVLLRTSAPAFDFQPTTIPDDIEVNENGDETFRLPDPEPYGETNEEVLIYGAEVFDVHCVYWADGSWYYSQEWDSESKQSRNALSESTLDVEDPSYSTLIAREEIIPQDYLPGALEVLLGVRDRQTGRISHARFVVGIMSAQETWTPAPEGLLEAESSSSRRRNRR